MIRLVLYFLGIAAVATGLSWLADRPGSLVVNWEGYEIETSVFRAVVILALSIAVGIFLWSLISQLFRSPATIGRFLVRKRQERGLDAISTGMIAIGAGDRQQAMRAALQARKALPNEPLTHLLRAQAAQLSGDRATSRRIYEAMLAQPDTEQLGLRGLFLEAEREGEVEAARQFAERALRLNNKLGWPVDALFELQVRERDWDGALETLATGKQSGQLDKAQADRRRAVLLTAKAQALEESNGNRAMELAAEAHTLAPGLIPAAAIAGRQLASRGATAKAAKIIEKTWRMAPHPELALVYAFARPGDSPRDRLERIKRLSRMTSHSAEGPIALATAAIEAREFAEARAALAPLVENEPTQRVCTLMARIETEETNDAGRAREWISRSVNAPRDPAWTSDGMVLDQWAPVSPVSGLLDQVTWSVPTEQAATKDSEMAIKRIEDLLLAASQPTTGGANADPAELIEPELTPKAPSTAMALRPRQVEADRPITVEVQPVAPQPAWPKPSAAVPSVPAKADPAMTISTSGKV